MEVIISFFCLIVICLLISIAIDIIINLIKFFLGLATLVLLVILGVLLFPVIIKIFYFIISILLVIIGKFFCF